MDYKKEKKSVAKKHEAAAGRKEDRSESHKKKEAAGMKKAMKSR